MQYKNIIFDLGNVLLEYDWETYLKSFGFDDETNQVLADAIFLSPVWEMGDEGLFTPAEWEEKFVANNPPYEPLIRDVYAGIERTISPFSYTDRWIQYWKEQGCQLYFLSNYSEQLHKVTKDMMYFLDDFEGGIFSYQVKCIKPDKQIYQLLLDNYNLDPTECMFFDDRQDNVETAKQLGIHGVVFTPDIAYSMIEDGGDTR